AAPRQSAARPRVRSAARPGASEIGGARRLGRRALGARLVALASAHPRLAAVVRLLAAPAELAARLLFLLTFAHDYARPPAKRWSCSARVGGAMSSVTSHCATSAGSASSARPIRSCAAATC